MNWCCVQRWRSVHKEILSIQFNVMSRAKTHSRFTHLVKYLPIGLNWTTSASFVSTMLEFPRTEDKWMIKWDHECGIKMSLLQLKIVEERRQRKSTVNLSEICVQHHVYMGKYNTHTRLRTHNRGTLWIFSRGIWTSKHILMIRFAVAKEPFQSVARFSLKFCISFIHPHSLMIEYHLDMRALYVFSLQRVLELNAK